MLVLDEADQMLHMGFLTEVEEILRHTPYKKQAMLFSATMPPIDSRDGGYVSCAIRSTLRLKPSALRLKIFANGSSRRRIATNRIRS